MDRQPKLRPIAAALANPGANHFALRIQEKDAKAGDGEFPAYRAWTRRAETQCLSAPCCRGKICSPLFNRYDGGELVVEDTFGMRAVKLRAGDVLHYSSSSVHCVEPVTRGSRIASFFWIESMVRQDEQRLLLFDLDMSILALRQQLGEAEPVVRLTGCNHNLMRMWADL